MVRLMTNGKVEYIFWGSKYVCLSRGPVEVLAGIFDVDVLISVGLVVELMCLMDDVWAYLGRGRFKYL